MDVRARTATLLFSLSVSLTLRVAVSPHVISVVRLPEDFIRHMRIEQLESP